MPLRPEEPRRRPDRARRDASLRPRSAGILLHRHRDGQTEVLLGHAGGPYWAHKQQGAWMIPKGAVEHGESPVEAAVREFTEEVGAAPPGDPKPLATIRQAGGKTVAVFALEGDFDPDELASSQFEMEWPPRSGRKALFPELDRVEWLTLDEAKRMILKSQYPVLEALRELLGAKAAGSEKN